MKRMSKWLSFVLILCLLGSMLPFALADGAETETAEEAAPAQEAAPAEEAAEAAEEAPAELTPKDPAAWTVMIYLCGTDLETDGGMATINLKMIANTVPNEKVNVLIQTGGTQSWQAQDEVGMDIASDRLQRPFFVTVVNDNDQLSLVAHIKGIQSQDPAEIPDGRRHRSLSSSITKLFPEASASSERTVARPPLVTSRRVWTAKGRRASAISTRGALSLWNSVSMPRRVPMMAA